MIRSLALLSLVAFAAGSGMWESGLSMNYLSFDSLLQSREEAESAGWIKVDPPTYSCGFDALSMYLNPNDTMVGLRFDENNRTAALQFNFPKDNITTHFNITEQGLISWNCTINNETVEYWSTSIFTVSEDAETRIAANNASQIIRSEDVTVQGFNGILDKIAANVTNLDSVWTKQACFLFMGQHYYYNMTTSLPCDKPFYSWFPLFDEDTYQLIGMGLMLMGSTTCKTEKPTKPIVSAIVPTAPDCMLDLVESVGAITVHIYFVDNPWLIIC